MIKARPLSFAFIIGLFLLCSFQKPSLLTAGHWKTFASHVDYNRIERFQDRIFIVSSQALFSTTADSVSMYASYSRLSGLSGTKIFDIAISSDSSLMAIVYIDGNIDIVHDDYSVVNIPDFKNKTITGDRTISSISTHGNQLFIATHFGFLSVDMKQGIIAQSYDFGERVNNIFSFRDSLHFSLQSGLYCSSTKDNLNDRKHWRKVFDNEFRSALSVNHNGKALCILLDADKTLYQYDDQWRLQFQKSLTDNSILRLTGNHIFCKDYGMLLIDIDKHGYARQSDSEFRDLVDAIALGDSTYLVASQSQGLFSFHIDQISGASMQTSILSDRYESESVGSSDIGRMLFYDGHLYALASGRFNINYDEGMYAIPGVISTYDVELDQWHNLTRLEVEPQKEASGSFFRQLSDFAVNPQNPYQKFVSTLGGGLWHFMGDSLVARYTSSNSPLGNPPGLTDYTRVNALMIDDNGYLWMANAYSDTVLTSLSPKGRWTRYPIKGFGGEAVPIVDRLVESNNDRHHFKWMMSGWPYMNCKIAMYYDNGTPEDLSDDASTSFSTLTDQDGNTYAPYFFNDLAEDHNGAMWLMTSSGPFVINDPYTCYKNPGAVNRIKIPRNDGTNLADYLMPAVNCYCIAIDAANRKWIGTIGDGLYLISADGMKSLEHFTTDNSPLLTNDILALAYDEHTGTLYISTEGGICAYTTDAIEGSDDFSNVYCYPNPIRPDYTGDLTIVGLMDQSQVRITDATNHVIWSSKSEGGMVKWDLRNNSGNRVKAGVYLIYGIDEEGKKGCVSKFLVVD